MSDVSEGRPSTPAEGQPVQQTPLEASTEAATEDTTSTRGKKLKKQSNAQTVQPNLLLVAKFLEHHNAGGDLNTTPLTMCEMAESVGRVKGQVSRY